VAQNAIAVSHWSINSCKPLWHITQNLKISLKNKLLLATVFMPLLESDHRRNDKFWFYHHWMRSESPVNQHLTKEKKTRRRHCKVFYECLHAVLYNLVYVHGIAGHIMSRLI